MLLGILGKSFIGVLAALCAFGFIYFYATVMACYVVHTAPPVLLIVNGGKLSLGPPTSIVALTFSHRNIIYIANISEKPF